MRRPAGRVAAAGERRVLSAGLLFAPDTRKTRRLAALKAGGVGSVKLDEHKDLAEIPNDDGRFVPCGNARLEGTKAFRVRKTVYGQERTVVVAPFLVRTTFPPWLPFCCSSPPNVRNLQTLHESGQLAVFMDRCDGQRWR